MRRTSYAPGTRCDPQSAGLREMPALLPARLLRCSACKTRLVDTRPIPNRRTGLCEERPIQLLNCHPHSLVGLPIQRLRAIRPDLSRSQDATASSHAHTEIDSIPPCGTSSDTRIESSPRPKYVGRREGARQIPPISTPAGAALRADQWQNAPSLQLCGPPPWAATQQTLGTESGR
jgi:hypothetical protein